MAAVYVSNLVIDSGTDFSQSFNLEASDTNSPINLTNATISSQMRKHAGSLTATNFTAIISEVPTSGKIYISLTNQQTSNLKPGRYIYDIILNKSGSKTKLVEGMVLVREGATQ